MPAAVMMGQKAQKNFTVKWFIKGMWQRASGVGVACVADLPDG